MLRLDQVPWRSKHPLTGHICREPDFKFGESELVTEQSAVKISMSISGKRNNLLSISVCQDT
jgi:hypothetical protein